MPINPSPSYHGYDVTDYRDINPDYGTLDDFREFVAAAHERGIAVIIDLVVNHSSVEHPWFVDAATNPDSAYADWYVWADENPGYRGPEGQVVWHRSGDRYYYGVFWSGMPDLNYENPDVTAEMYDIARFWLEETGIDGFRLDAIKYVVANGELQENTPANRAWLEAFHDYMRSVNPEALLVGEAWLNTVQVAPYVPGSVDLAFEFELARSIVRGAAFGITGPFREAHQRVLDLFTPGQYATFLTNHDQDRVIDSVRGDVGAARVAASVYLTSPGVPFIYYGEEIGMSGTKPDPEIRTPMQWYAGDGAGFTTGTPWQLINADVAEGVNVAAQDADPGSLLNHYRGLVQARSASRALLRGDFAPVENGTGNIYSFLRYIDGEAVLVVINLRGIPFAAGDYVLSLGAGPLADVSEVEVLYADSEVGEVPLPEINADGGFDAYTPLAELPGRGTLILRLR
ncbi:alpha-amylase [bacterium]|nr:alpha-amylase [bacterium]